MSLLEKVDPTSPHFDIREAVAQREELYRLARQAERRPSSPSDRHRQQGRLLLTSADRMGEGTGLRIPWVPRKVPSWEERLATIVANHQRPMAQTRGTPLEEAAQRNLLTDLIAAMKDQSRRDREQAWAQATKSDPEIGGGNLADNLRFARWALDHFGDPELYDYLDESGLANHPELIRMATRIGKAFNRKGMFPTWSV